MRGWPVNRETVPSRERVAGVSEALPLLMETVPARDCPPVSGRQTTHTPLSPTPQSEPGLSVCLSFPTTVHPGVGPLGPKGPKGIMALGL